MPSRGFEGLVERAVTDEAFAARLKTEREAVLAEFDLTEDEKEALRSGDPQRAATLGLDERVSKALAWCT